MTAAARPPAAAPACPTENAVELADVTFGYDPRRPVLRGIDMTIPRGKVVAIMGGSGCGKTTILRLIGGQLRPAGRARAASPASRCRTSTATRCSRCAARSACCSSSARCSPTCPCSRTSRSRCASTRTCPRSSIRDLVLMKLQRGRLARHRAAASRRSCRAAWRGAWRSRARSRSIRCSCSTTSRSPASIPISLGVVGQLIRKLNDALGITSVVVTHDVYESLKIVDYLYFVSEGRIIAQGTPDEVQRVDGPVRAPVRRRRSPTVRCRSTIRRPPYAEELAAHAG